jgi:hypothetical protein
VGVLNLPALSPKKSKFFSIQAAGSVYKKNFHFLLQEVSTIDG